MSLQMIGIVAGLLALGWAFAVRRSPVDCVLAALCGVLLLMMAMGWTEPLRLPGYYLLPELVLGGLGIALLVRALGSRSRPPQAAAGDGRGGAGLGEGAGFTPQYTGQLPPHVQRTGLIVIGVIVLIPLLLFALLIGAFMWGGRGSMQKAQEESEQRGQQMNPATEQAVRATLDRPATASFRNHRWITERIVANRYLVPDSSRCGEFTAEGMQGVRSFIYDVYGGRLFLADERGMLRFHNFHRDRPDSFEYGVPVGPREQPRQPVEEASLRAFCG